jgi:hypothetical protein
MDWDPVYPSGARMVLGAPGEAHMAKLESAGPDFKNHAQICEG